MAKKESKKKKMNVRVDFTPMVDMLMPNLLIERGQNLIPLEPDHHIHALFYYNAYAVLNKSGETERSQIYYKKAYALKEHSRYIKARIDEPKTKEEKNRIKHPWYIIYLSFWNHDIENISE